MKMMYILVLGLLFLATIASVQSKCDKDIISDMCDEGNLLGIKSILEYKDDKDCAENAKKLYEIITKLCQVKEYQAEFCKQYKEIEEEEDKRYTQNMDVST